MVLAVIGWGLELCVGIVVNGNEGYKVAVSADIVNTVVVPGNVSVLTWVGRIIGPASSVNYTLKDEIFLHLTYIGWICIAMFLDSKAIIFLLTYCPNIIKNIHKSFSYFDNFENAIKKSKWK